ncbi:hypothetical protein AHAS_Ahas18G0050100 [Arachis hypogaea]
MVVNIEAELLYFFVSVCRDFSGSRSPFPSFPEAISKSNSGGSFDGGGHDFELSPSRSLVLSLPLSSRQSHSLLNLFKINEVVDILLEFE